MDREEAIKKIKEIIEDAPCGFVATCPEGQPRVRAMSLIPRPVSPSQGGEGLNLWVSTYADSEKVKEMKKNPQVEISWIDSEHREVRLQGEVRFLEELEKKRTLLEERPELSHWYKGPDDPRFALIEIVPKRVAYPGGVIEF